MCMVLELVLFQELRLRVSTANSDVGDPDVAS
jgi:hypothetical protein